MEYLELEEVLRIHERMIVQYGGSFGILNQAALESSLAAPQQTMFGEDLYPDVTSKAAILVYLLIKNHPFMDGNKRTAFACLMRFLHVNLLAVTLLAVIVSFQCISIVAILLARCNHRMNSVAE